MNQSSPLPEKSAELLMTLPTLTGACGAMKQLKAKKGKVGSLAPTKMGKLVSGEQTVE